MLDASDVLLFEQDETWPGFAAHDPASAVHGTASDTIRCRVDASIYLPISMLLVHPNYSFVQASAEQAADM